LSVTLCQWLAAISEYSKFPVSFVFAVSHILKTTLGIFTHAMLARVLAVIVCPFVCLSHAGIVS